MILLEELDSWRRSLARACCSHKTLVLLFSMIALCNPGCRLQADHCHRRGATVQAASGSTDSLLPVSRPHPSTRRQQLLSGAALLVGLQSLQSAAYADGAPPQLSYTDPVDGFSLAVPAGWVLGGGDLDGSDGQAPRSRFSNAAGLQRVVAWVAPDSGDVSVAVTIRTPAADFTSLGSFGRAQDFGENLVASMDRSYMLRQPKWARRGEPVVTAKLLSATDSQGRYVIEYEVGKEGAPTRTVVSAVAMGTNQRGLRRLFTVNASCTDAEVERYRSVLREVVDSFALPA